MNGTEDMDVSTEPEDLADLNDHVFDMFNAQNAIVGMDLRHSMSDLLGSGDPDIRSDLALYATKVEAFMKYASENSEKLTRTLSLLRGE